jgi:hypothetical protein
MFLRVVTPALFAAFMLGTFNAPAHAVTAKEKMETCKFGADDQKLSGPEHKAFMKKCMAAGDGPPEAKAKKKKKSSGGAASAPPPD